MRRPIMLIPVVTAMLIAACGGSEDEGEPDPPGAVATTQAATSNTTTGEGATPDTTAPSEDDVEPDAASDSTSGAGAHQATATIDGETYSFGDTGFAAQRCNPSTFGAFFAVLYMVDDQGNPNIDGGVFGLVLPHEDTDPAELDQWPELKVSISDPDLEWIADEIRAEEFDLEPGMSQVDSYTIDGSRASGSATFYESDSYWVVLGGQADAVETAQGTFEVICADS